MRHYEADMVDPRSRSGKVEVSMKSEGSVEWAAAFAACNIAIKQP